MTLQRLSRRWRRGDQAGQAIILIAIGFLGLLGFVGIVTDLSVAYVRFAALRRATDSAAIAAAGQMRKDREYGQVELAARQMLEFHGIDNATVEVQTCLIAAEIDPLDPQLCDINGDGTIDGRDQNKRVRVRAQSFSPFFFMHLFQVGQGIDLRAEAISETASLDVVLIFDVSESMAFETTYDTWRDELGVNIRRYAPRNPDTQWFDLVVDAATGRREFECFSARFPVPPLPLPAGCPASYNTANPRDPNAWLSLRSKWSAANSPAGATTPLEFTFNGESGTFALYQYILTRPDDEMLSGTLSVTGPRASVSINVAPVEYTSTAPAGTTTAAANVVTSGTAFDASLPLRPECRIRVNPTGALIGPPAITAELEAANPLLNYAGLGYYAHSFLRPNYNFYGCCNDPTGGASVSADGTITGVTAANLAGNPDFDFSDVVCQPFKAAKDATRQFLGRVDFGRGDRVAFVTFDRSAYLVDPDGLGGTFQVNRDGVVTTETLAGGPRTHMIEQEAYAVEVLNQVLGVRAEPNFYDSQLSSTNPPVTMVGGNPVTGVALWTRFSNGTAIATDAFGNDYLVADGGYTMAEYNALTTGEHINYLAFGACPLYNAANYSFLSIYASPPLWTAGDTPLNNIMLPPYQGGWTSIYDSLVSGKTIPRARYSYDVNGSCAGTNVGAGLRESNNALVNSRTLRTNSVWVVVLLTDGAAGATDPVLRNGAPAVQSNPYNNVSGTLSPVAGEYGGYGLCPFGDPDRNAPWPADAPPNPLSNPLTYPTNRAYELMRDPDLEFPLCLDRFPDTRDYCVETRFDAVTGLPVNPDWRNALANLDILAPGNNTAVCANRYDPDDYARDWADFIAREDPNQLVSAQLPVIFTIAFGLDFPDGTGTPCTTYQNYHSLAAADRFQNVESCLAEALLRYIADVGDNNRIDGYGNTVGPYIETGTVLGRNQQDLGNYYNAPDGAALERVFNDIASRLFTRLAG